LRANLTLDAKSGNQNAGRQEFDGDGAFRLLLKCMEALRLKPDEVMRIEPGVFWDLVSGCAKCAGAEKCDRNLRSGRAHVWQSHCSNAATLRALIALPWFGKARTENPELR
jgi:hypothetical protein